MMMLDGLLCFLFPRLARWRCVVVDRANGKDIPMKDVRFRWQRSAVAWCVQTTTQYLSDPAVTFAVRRAR